jgi:hypothetical protein
MSDTTPDLAEVLRRVDRLSPQEQLRVVDHIAERLERVVGSAASASTEADDAAWERLFELGDKVAEGRTSPETANELLTAMRR